MAANVDTANHSAKFIEDMNIQKQLLLKRLESMEEEFMLLNYNLISAKVLFKTGSSESKDVPKSPPTDSSQVKQE